MLTGLSRSLRALRFFWWWLRSALVLGWYQALYPTLTVGRKVRLRRGVYLHIVRGGSLRIGDNSYLDSYCQIIAHGHASIGARAFVGLGATIVAAEQVTIGDDALIAAYVTIRDQDHRLDGDEPFNRQGLVTAPVRIADNVWIGTKATILKGVTIGEGSVVAAHAVVRDAVDRSTVVGGIPARLIRKLADANPQSCGS